MNDLIYTDEGRLSDDCNDRFSRCGSQGSKRTESVPLSEYYGSSVASSSGKKTSLCMLYLGYAWNRLTLFDLDYVQLKFLLYITLIMNIIMLLIEIGNCIYYLYSVTENIWIPFFILALNATILTAIICGMLMVLIFKPSTGCALTTGGFILLSELVYLVQVVMSLRFQMENMTPLFSALLAVLFVFYFWSAILMYRFWEYLLFNYEDPDPGSGTTGDLLAAALIEDDRNSSRRFSTRVG